VEAEGPPDDATSALLQPATSFFLLSADGVQTRQPLSYPMIYPKSNNRISCMSSRLEQSSSRGLFRQVRATGTVPYFSIGSVAEQNLYKPLLGTVRAADYFRHRWRIALTNRGPSSLFSSFLSMGVQSNWTKLLELQKPKHRAMNQCCRQCFRSYVAVYQAQ